MDGIARVLNEIFTKYGDSLPFGFMVFDYGGHARCGSSPREDMKAMDVLGKIYQERQRTMDDMLGGLVKLIAKGELKDLVERLVKASPAVKLAKGLQTLPPTQNLAQHEAAA